MSGPAHPGAGAGANTQVMASSVRPDTVSGPPVASTPPTASPRARRVEVVVGLLALVGTAATVVLGLWVTPPDAVQGDLVRLVYVHPGVAWVALYAAFSLAAVSSLL